MTRFSIVIPTRNRAHLLDSAIRSALTQEHDDFEVVVSTNNCADDSVEVVRRHMCERLRHVQTRRTLSMPEHWEFAVGHAQGELVGVLCDDDALIPDALRELDELFNRLPDTDAIVYNIARYFHPDAIAGYPPNVLCLQEPSFEVTRPDPDQQLRGIAAGNGRAVIFRKGKKARIVAEADMLTALMEEVRAVAAGVTPGA